MSDQTFGARHHPLDQWGREVREFLRDRGFGGSNAPGTRPAVLVIGPGKALTALKTDL